MKMYKKVLLSGVMGVLFAGSAHAQCETWNDSPDMKKAKLAHQTYRAALKSKKYDLAFENWKVAYDIAPAADGKRDSHYSDGATIYVEKFKNATSEADKTAHKAKIYELYDQAIKCYESGAIKVFKCTGDDCADKKIGSITEKKLYNQYYFLNAPYEEIISSLDVIYAKSGDSMNAFVINVAAPVLVYQYQSNLLTKDQAKTWYDRLSKVAETNIASNAKAAASFKEAKTNLDKEYAKVADSFKSFEEKKAEIRAEYAGSSDPEVIKLTVAKLVNAGAPDNDPFLVELKGKYASYANAVNAQNQAARDAKRAAAIAASDANNPHRVAAKAYKAGDYATALTKYDEAIAKATDSTKKGDYQYRKAKIYFKQNKYSQARSAAKKAASLKSGWGAPYLLIGDMYVKSAKSCGDGWNQRLAILAAVDKYRKAKSVDPSAASDAQSRISKYSGRGPSKQDAFMRGVTPGGTAKVSCWIGETVRVKTN